MFRNGKVTNLVGHAVAATLKSSVAAGELTLTRVGGMGGGHARAIGHTASMASKLIDMAAVGVYDVDERRS